jgi:zinc transport system ATP-binding protein
MSISCDNLFFSYPKTPVLKDVNFSIKKGEFVGLFGPNGGGKTTLLMLLLGFLKPTDGAIVMDECVVGYVPQRLRFDAKFPISTIEVILMGRLAHLPWYGRYSAKDKALAEKALDEVGLTAFRNAPFGSLSGGQAQRVLLARALVSKPDILFLDEPTSCVDKESEQKIYALLKALRPEITILMVTHHLDAAIGHVDRLLCVHSSVQPFTVQQVCSHFAMGLYHPSLACLHVVKDKK